MTQQVAQDPPARLFPNRGGVVSKFVIAASIVSMALFVFSLLGRYFLFAELVCNFRFQIILMMVPVACFALGSRQWLLSSLLVVAIGWGLLGIVWVYLPENQPPPGPRKFRVMSYNVLASNSNHNQIVHQILESDPDLISILEYSLDWHEALVLLNETYPYQVSVPRWHGFGIAMFSKYPLSETKVVQLTKSSTDNPFIMTNVSFGDQTIRMAALHTLSPTDRQRLDLRNEQFSEIAKVLSHKDLPTVVMGDFNCTPWSSFLIEFVKKTGYRDSRRGFGFQATWPAGYWVFRIPIDHAFVSTDVHVHSREVGAPSGSDHLPIIFEVSTAK